MFGFSICKKQISLNVSLPASEHPVLRFNQISSQTKIMHRKEPFFPYCKKTKGHIIDRKAVIKYINTEILATNCEPTPI